MGHSRRKRPTSGATLVRYRLARRWNPISSPSFDYQAGIPGCDGLAGVSPQHAAQASLRTGSQLHHIPAQARAAPPNGRKMGHDPSLTIEKWVISGENDPLVGRRLYDNAGPTLVQTSILSLRFPAHKPRRRGGFRAHDDPTESGKVLGTAPVRHWPPPTRAGATGDPKVGPTAAAGVEKWVLPSDRGPLMGHTAGGPPG